MGNIKKIPKDHAFIHFSQALAFMITDQKSKFCFFNRAFPVKWGPRLSGHIAFNIGMYQQIVKRKMGGPWSLPSSYAQSSRATHTDISNCPVQDSTEEGS